MADSRRREELEREIRTAHAEISALVHDVAARQKAGVGTGELEKHLDQLLETQADRIGLWIALANSKTNEPSSH
jgi:hypothetical protein